MTPFSEKTKKPSVCLVHDWLVAMRGGEKVLEAIAELFPNAPIYTLFADRKRLSPVLQKRTIRTSFLQWVPGISRFYRWFLPLFPLAIRSINVQKYDVVISSSHCVAKAVRIGNKATHICYCHTPMRYLWEFQNEYFGRFPRLMQRIIQVFFGLLREWDALSVRSVHSLIANSDNTCNKIRHFYGRESSVIYPPVALPPDHLDGHQSETRDFYLIVSALVPYKRIELAIEAFNRLRRPLKIVGDGPLRKHLKRMIKYEGIELEGWLKSEALWNRYANARALIFPGEEDFGIVPVEAQMFGKPVIAFGKGGVLETVRAHNDVRVSRTISESTGLFFYEQSQEALMTCIHEAEQLSFDPVFIRAHAKTFGRNRFKKEITELLKRLSVPVSAQYVTFGKSRDGNE